MSINHQSKRLIYIHQVLTCNLIPQNKFQLFFLYSSNYLKFEFMIKIKFWNYENARNEGEINNGCFTTLVPYKILLLLSLLFCVKFEFHVVKLKLKERNLDK